MSDKIYIETQDDRILSIPLDLASQSSMITNILKGKSIFVKQ
jgi:hypothetical protein